jgi:CheY-like chemotaxis protein
VRLPAVQASTAPVLDELPAVERTSQPGARRILLVDDNEDARLLLAEMLVTLGYAVHMASNGIEALDSVLDVRPDLAILDIGLPGMNGYELASRIRDALDGNIRLIALTGYGQPDDVARSQRAGFDAHLVKPVSINRLIELIQRRE